MGRPYQVRCRAWHESRLCYGFGRQLYERGFPSAQQSIVDEAQAARTIDFKQNDQVAAVRDIVNLIVIDPPVAMVSKLINSFHRVSTCRRK